MKRPRARTRRSIGGWGALASVGLALGVLVISQGNHAPDTAAVTPDAGPTTSVTANATPLATDGASLVPPVSLPTVPPRAPASVAMPDASLTPGATFAAATAAQVCTPGWAARHRSVTLAQYHQVYGEYHIPYPQPSGTYELDHLIPLELGGDNANANLWPEAAAPPPGFRQKDALENALHDRVCAGTLGLVEAQREIASNWYATYLKYVGG